MMMSLFSEQCLNLCLLYLAFIIFWRVGVPFTNADHALVPSEKHFQAMFPLAQPSCEKAEGRKLLLTIPGPSRDSERDSGDSGFSEDGGATTPASTGEDECSQDTNSTVAPLLLPGIPNMMFLQRSALLTTHHCCSLLGTKSLSLLRDAKQKQMSTTDRCCYADFCLVLGRTFRVSC